MEHLSQLTAGEAARRMREGLLTAEELVAACLERTRSGARGGRAAAQR